MQIDDLRTLIKECIQEAFDEEGWMQAVNVRENASDRQTKLLRQFGSTEFFFGTDPHVITMYNGTDVNINVTLQRRGDSYYIQLDK